MKRKAFLIVGIVLAILAGYGTFKILMFEQKRVDVVVATKRIPIYSKLDEGMVRIEKIHPSGLQPGAIQSVASVKGMVCMTDILPNQQILSSQINDQPVTGFRAKLKENELAIGLNADLVSTVGGTVSPGDFVDVIAEPQVKVPGNVPKGVIIARGVEILGVVDAAGNQVRDTVLNQMINRATGSIQDIVPPKGTPNVVYVRATTEQAQLLAGVQGKKAMLAIVNPLYKDNRAVPEEVKTNITGTDPGTNVIGGIVDNLAKGGASNGTQSANTN